MAKINGITKSNGNRINNMFEDDDEDIKPAKNTKASKMTTLAELEAWMEENGNERGKPKFPDNVRNTLRFQYVANRRVPACLKAMEAVARMSNANMYSYTDEERDTVLSMITNAYNSLVKSLKNPRKSAKVTKDVRIFG